MDLPDLFWKEKLNFHCSILNLFMNEVATHVYVIRPFGYRCFLQQEYISNVINIHGNGVLKNNNHKQ